MVKLYPLPRYHSVYTRLRVKDRMASTLALMASVFQVEKISLQATFFM